jgi:hypothetical protein
VTSPQVVDARFRGEHERRARPDPDDRLALDDDECVLEDGAVLDVEQARGVQGEALGLAARARQRSRHGQEEHAAAV